MSALLTIFLATGAAFFYMAASWAMKAWGGTSLVLLVPAVLVILAIGAVFEIEVLKFARLGHVIVMVLAIEMLMTFVVSTMVIGETYTPREVTGIAIVVAGLMMLNWPASERIAGPHAEAGSSSTTTVKTVRLDRVPG